MSELRVKAEAMSEKAELSIVCVTDILDLPTNPRPGKLYTSFTELLPPMKANQQPCKHVNPVLTSSNDVCVMHLHALTSTLCVGSILKYENQDNSLQDNLRRKDVRCRVVLIESTGLYTKINLLHRF